MTLTLSPQQAAVENFILHETGSANVIARAGTGKTLTLTRGGIKAIAVNNLGSAAIMAFNKSAAVEFQERIDMLDCDTSMVQSGTVHSFGFAAVRKWAGRKRWKAFGGKVWKICKNLAEKDAIETDKSIYTTQKGAIMRLVSLGKQTGIGFTHSIDDHAAWHNLMDQHSIEPKQDIGSDTIIRAAITVMKESIEQNRHTIDFDDMIFMPLYHNITMPQFDFVLIDEAQDTNPARRALALKMLKPGGRMIAVGDDRQAIYGFTGADADALDLIASEVNAINLPLTVTYRCPKAVVREANRIVPDLEAHPDAPEGIVRTVKYHSDTEGHFFHSEGLNETDGVICRNVAPLMELAYSLMAAKKGVKVEGKDIGKNLIDLIQRFKARDLSSLVDCLNDWKESEVQKWQAKERYNLAQSAEDRASAITYVALSLIHDGKSDVSDLVNFIKDLFDQKKSNVITLTTIHKAKGREWERVYFLHRAKTIPSKWAKKAWEKEQEANLEYVGITRAESELIYVD